MIQFYDGHLVPSELCEMLYQVVPKEYHLPVRFHNRRRKDVHGERGTYPLGSLSFRRGRVPAHININPIYEDSLSSGRSLVSAPSTAVWRNLLEVCLHEFGHVATNRRAFRMNQHEYHAEYGYGRVYRATECLADEWMQRRIGRVLEVEPRLQQPLYMTGYLGARIFKWRAYASVHKSGKAYSAYVKEMRCRKTGAQLTSGDVLSELGIEPYFYPNAYEVLRRASVGVGIDYTDAAGRHHKLYTWGDLPLMARRMNELSWKLRERRYPEAREEAEIHEAGFEDIPF